MEVKAEELCRRYLSSCYNSTYSTNSFVFLSTDPTVNTAICDTLNYYCNPTIISSGSSGAIIAWEGSRPTGEYTYLYGVFAQKVDSLGNNLWEKNGVRVCSTDYVLFGLLPTITDDGAGGAITVWRCCRFMWRNPWLVEAQKGYEAF